MDETTWIGALAAAAVVSSAVVFALARRSRQARDEARMKEAVEKNLHVPPSLHPVIDADICIGSLSCIQGCPEGDILGVVDGRARLIHAAHCIGHGKCALECPVNAITLVFGTSERGMDLPEVDPYFESSRPGVHVVGELGGMGLIQNAVRQGLAVSERLGAVVRSAPAGAGMVDVAIVGAGPAGIATAVGLRAKGKSFRILEQGRFGGTIANYPRQKLVMSEPLQLPLYGKLGKKLIRKEELLSALAKVAKKADLRIEEGTRVEGLEGRDGDFTIATSNGPVRARKVVLAAGRRGTPRKLGVPGEELDKVSYSLIDASQYEGCKMLVVGGGDAAVEAALQLCEESDAEVTLSYRGEALSRCREANRQKVEALVHRRRLRALLPSVVKQIHEEAVDLDAGGRPVRLKNNYVIASLGGELPSEWLKNMGVMLRRHHGTLPGVRAPEPGRPRAAAAAPAPAKGEAAVQAKKDRRLALALFTLGALIVAALAVAGWDYYRLPRMERIRSPLHEALRPAGNWGHGVGIAATAVMLSNFLYSARKRWRFLKGAAPIRRWLTFHVFVGFMSPVVIAFHAAFQSNNALASATAGSLAVVVLTGLIGRFLYGLVPTRDGRAMEYADVAARWERLKVRVEPLLEGVADPAAVRRVLSMATAPARSGSLLALFFQLPFESLGERWQLARIRRLFEARTHYRDFRDAFLRLSRLRVQVGFYRSLKKLLAGWRMFHVVLALLLVVMITAHIGLSLFLGYWWIF